MKFFKEFKKLLSELSEFAKQTGYTSNHDFFMDTMHHEHMHQQMNEQMQRQMNEQMHQQMFQDMEFTRMAGTGIEFGGFNPDPGMNPGMMNNGMF